MAVDSTCEVIETFDDWYIDRRENAHSGCLEHRGMTGYAGALLGKYRKFKREMDARCANYYKLEMLADAEVISPKPDLPNISSGETAGLIRRMARNQVQHAPNVTVISKHDDDSVPGIFAKYILRSKIIGSDTYSNDMQQNLFASTKTALALGFDCVIPCLLQDASGAWYIKYDVIHYRDVFPEPGAKDVRDTTEVFVRRYLTEGEIKGLIRQQVEGWDIAALKTLLKSSPVAPPREAQSNSHQDKKHKMSADGYEIVTWYSNTGEDFLTFSPATSMLLRIEENRHPLKKHPVFFLIMEKDNSQPLGKSQVELVLGRQEFQDLMLNGAMKLWYRNINPTIMGYGAIGTVPNLSPGKYTNVSNPNARIEPFEVNTQTLMQYSVISQGNLGSMVSMVGAADQQMAAQAGNGMSATPQGVEAQQQMVDTTTNNYQKAIESFFSHYCSYALTIYFQELKSVKKVTPSADARAELINAGLPITEINDDGSIEIDFSDLAVEYFVKCVPGSLVELEDEKQIRILQELFVPLSQSMPALAATGNQELLQHAAQTMQYIIETQIELSGSNRSGNLKSIFSTGRTQQFNEYEGRAAALEESISGVAASTVAGLEAAGETLVTLMQQVALLKETQGAILEKLGVPNEQSAVVEANPAAESGALNGQPIQ